jgi:general secretion pathway protein J
MDSNYTAMVTPCAGLSRQKSSRKDRQRGLTLIELLIAISVLAFVAVLGWRGLDTIVRTRAALNEDLERTRGLQLAFAQMQTDSASIASAAQLPNRSPVDIGRDRLTLVRTTGGDGQPTRLQVITYRVRDGVLTRQESAPTRDLNELQKIFSAALNDFNTANAVALQTGVAGMAMRVWDGSGWRAQAPAPQSQSAPPDGRVGKGQRELEVTGRASSAAPTGLEVALQMQQGEATMQKVFLLGAI